MRNNLLFFAFRSGSIGLQFAILWFVANYLKAEIGASLLFGLNFCLMFAELGRFATDNVVLRDYGKPERRKSYSDLLYERAIFEFVLLVSSAMALIAVAFVYISVDLFPDKAVATVSFMQLFAIPLLSVILSRSFVYYASGQSYRAVLWGQYTIQFCLGANVIFAAYRDSIAGIVAFICVAFGFFLVWLLRLLCAQQECNRELKTACKKDLFDQSKVFFLTLCFVIVVGWAPQVISGLVLDPSEYTHLVILVRLAAAVLIPGGMFVPKLSPNIARLWAEKNRAGIKVLYRRFQLYYFLSAFFVAIVVVGVAPHMLGVSNFFESELIMPLAILLSAQLVSCAFGPNFMTLIMCNQERVVLKSSVVAAFAMVLNIYFLGQFLGGLGVALSMFVVIVLQNIYHYVSVNSRIFNGEVGA